MLIDYFVRGGWVMWPILAASVVALAVVINRVSFILRHRGDVEVLRAEVMASLDLGRLPEAKARCAGSRTQGAAVLLAGLGAWDLSEAELNRRLETAAGEELARAESGLSLLATMIAVLPMLGFLGTIVGLIGAFEAWARAGEAVKLEDLSSGISEAMITTAAGLIASIPYVVAYNALASRVGRLARDLNAVGADLAGRRAALRERAEAGPAAPRRRAEENAA